MKPSIDVDHLETGSWLGLGVVKSFAKAMRNLQSEMLCSMRFRRKTEFSVIGFRFCVITQEFGTSEFQCLFLATVPSIWCGFRTILFHISPKSPLDRRKTRRVWCVDLYNQPPTHQETIERIAISLWWPSNRKAIRVMKEFSGFNGICYLKVMPEKPFLT